MRLIDADALKEEVKTLFCPDGYKIMMLIRIDNAPTVAVNCKDCDGYEAGYSAGYNDGLRSNL